MRSIGTHCPVSSQSPPGAFWGKGFDPAAPMRGILGLLRSGELTQGVPETWDPEKLPGFTIVGEQGASWKVNVLGAYTPTSSLDSRDPFLPVLNLRFLRHFLKPGKELPGSPEDKG